MKGLVSVCISTLALLAVPAPTEAQTVAVVPFGACGWTWWTDYAGDGGVGCAPFVQPWAGSEFGCSNAVGTVPRCCVNFFISRHITSGSTGNGHLEVFGIGLADVYWNGVNVIRANNPNSACTQLVNTLVTFIKGDNVLEVHGIFQWSSIHSGHARRLS
jgi:hypothetical protein